MTLGTTACGDSSSPNGSDGGAADNTDTATAGGTDEAPTGPEGDTDTGQPPGETDDDPSPGSSGLGESTGAVEPDCDLDCGADGFCDIDGHGTPYCSCDEGFASIGLGCVPCQAVAGTVPADVPIVDAVVNLTIGGASPPASVHEAGLIHLRSTVSGDELVLGSTRNGELTKTIIPGWYEVYYAKAQGGAEVPSNKNAHLGTILFDDAGPIDIDIPMVTIGGTITFSGETPPETVTDFGRIVLVDPITGDEVGLGGSYNGSFIVNVVPGKYEIRYRAVEIGSDAPVNGDAFLGMLSASADGREQEHTIDVPVVNAGGTITINGAAPPATVTDFGHIVLADTSTGDRIVAGQTSNGDYALNLVAGTYEVFYELAQGGEQVPINRRARLGTLDARDGSDGNIDVPMVPLAGAFQIDGQIPPQDASDDGVIVLRTDDGDEAILGNTHASTYAAMLVPGTYGVYYAQETAGAIMPGNTNARFDELTLSEPSSETLNVPLATVSGLLEVSGSVPPDSVYDDGRVYLRNAATGDSVLLGSTRSGSYFATVVPGQYDLVYEAEISDEFVPVNKAALLQSALKIDGDVALDIDIPVARIDGAMTVGQRPPPSSSTEVGNLYLQDLATEDLIWLGSTAAPAFDRPLAAGRYLLRYRSVGAGESIPANADAGIACFDVLESP